MRLRRNAGLTLLEVVVAVSLLSLLMAGVMTALRLGLNANDLKLITAVFVFAALILPGFLKRFQARKAQVSRA